MSVRPTRIGVVSDTHGYLDRGLFAALEGVDLVLHAGDIGSERVLERLRSLAPLVAVAGNGDSALASRYPWDQRVEVAGTRILLCHWYDNFGRIHPKIRAELARWRPRVLVYGHTHTPHRDWVEGVLHLNPGYAGPPGPGRRRSVARLVIESGRVAAEIVPLPG